MSCYHKCIKFYFGLKRCDSTTKTLFKLALQSYITVIDSGIFTISERGWQSLPLPVPFPPLPFLPPPLPLLSPPLPFPPLPFLEVGPFNPARGSGGPCELFAIDKFL